MPPPPRAETGKKRNERVLLWLKRLTGPEQSPSEGDWHRRHLNGSGMEDEGPWHRGGVMATLAIDQGWGTGSRWTKATAKPRVRLRFGMSGVVDWRFTSGVRGGLMDAVQR